MGKLASRQASTSTVSCPFPVAAPVAYMAKGSSMASRRSARVVAPLPRTTIDDVQTSAVSVRRAHSQRAVAKLGQPTIGHSMVIDAGAYEAVSINRYTAWPANKARVSV